MSGFFSSGAAIDVALAVIAVEAMALAIWRARSSRGIGAIDLIGQLLAGVFLLLALRAALRGSDWRWTALFLAASFPAHLFDLLRRWRKPQ